MPNHIKNRIELLGSIEDLDSLIKKFSTYHKASINKTHDDSLIICRTTGKDWGFCWLNPKTGEVTDRGDLRQIGIPDGFEIEVNDSYSHFPDFKKVIPPPDTDAYNDIPSQEKVKHLPDWWYTWNRNNWGTKWNSYACERPSINVFEFETAWCSVYEIIEVISHSFPNVTIKYSWADEDTGSNCGRSVWRNGLVEESIPKSQSKEAYELAFELRPDRAENYILVGDNYEYKEDE